MHTRLGSLPESARVQGGNVIGVRPIGALISCSEHTER
jgi:hypothetical protein